MDEFENMERGELKTLAIQLKTRLESLTERLNDARMENNRLRIERDAFLNKLTGIELKSTPQAKVDMEEGFKSLQMAQKQPNSYQPAPNQHTAPTLQRPQEKPFLKPTEEERPFKMTLD